MSGCESSELKWRPPIGWWRCDSFGRRGGEHLEDDPKVRFEGLQLKVGARLVGRALPQPVAVEDQSHPVQLYMGVVLVKNGTALNEHPAQKCRMT